MAFLPHFIEESNSKDPLLGHECLSVHHQHCARNHCRPWQRFNMMCRVPLNLSKRKNGFEVSLDVQQFRPQELSVKVVDDFVVVEGNHGERNDEHGFVSRQFRRRYALPEDVDPCTVESTLSSDGVLSISAPVKVSPSPANERAIPIIVTNTPLVKPHQMSGKGDATHQETMDQ